MKNRKNKSVFGSNFWDQYAENHFWKLNEKSAVKENSKYYDRTYNYLIPQDPSLKILDIGCGGGHFLHYLLRRGFRNITGIDLAPGLVKFVKDNIHPNVFHAEALSFLKKKKQSYDLLVANDFIEHLPKDLILEFLSRCQHALKKNGRLIIKTPNMANLFAGRHRYVDFTHEVGFTEHSISEVCLAARFSKAELYPEFFPNKEPLPFRLIRKLYALLGEEPPRILTTNLIVVCKK